MQRVLVMGSSGSGKSTFARRLSDITGIPTVSIDALFWKPGWVESEKEEFENRMIEAAQQPRWIVDGNYLGSGAGELRRQLSDTVVWFDLPRSTCMLGVFKRIAASYGKVRPEMAAGCPEKIDLEFFRYVWAYRRQQRPKLVAYFQGLRPDQTLVCFTDHEQADDYLEGLALKQKRASIH
ncbi:MULTISPECIES: DNA topology modulation protein [unclassified Bradyrhizobium]|uniref:DNA topology modulation protein n=1 Tax=unclassified Bradyrhizobium TaxID=2631580 RepID=UPI002479A9C5|nr:MULTISPECIES: DNA topology modulation protein [unclassified Bradyrhizobium]WGS17424.1 DNA topology modulation protein [Bradyrhizobium sp. ISRA463]WGS24199.1 DNA topology modulation protein [Bradyrhizobium sp. ISRA464]